MEVAIIMCAAVIIVCIIANKFTNRYGIPTVLIFMMVGMLFGSEGIVKVPFDDFGQAEKICSTALIFIMFYGGFGTNFQAAKPVLSKAVSMATVGVVLTAGITGLFCYLVMGMSMQEGLLLGAVVGSTDAASVFSILRSKSLDLKDGTASLLEVESGSNDPFSYMMTMIILSWMGGGDGNIVLLLLKQMGFGILFGVGIGILAVKVLKRDEFEIEGIDTILMISLVLFAYAGPVLLGGNGFLSVYLLGIIVGNKKFKNKVQMIHFFDGVNHLAQILIFFLLGLLVFPSSLVPIFGKALLVFIGLTFIARPLTAALLLTPQKSSWRQQVLVSFAGLRGAASIVFAIMVTISPVYTKDYVFNVVFCIALISAVFQGMLLPVAAKRLDMVDDTQNVLKTFSDYQDEQQMHLIQIVLKKNHRYIGKKIAELHLGDVLAVLIERGEETLIPRGEIVLQEGDILVLSGESYQGDSDTALDELHIPKDNIWIGKKVSELPGFEKSLIVLIRRIDGTTVIPKGDTQIREGDTLVLQKGLAEEKD